MKNKVMLIDEPIEIDERVKIAARRNNINQVEFCNIHNTQLALKDVSINILISSFFIFLTSFIKTLYIKKKFNLTTDSIFSGLSVALIKKQACTNQIKIFKSKDIFKDADLVYANDLYCGIIAASLSDSYNYTIFYDAHEVEFQRNRKNGIIRLCLDLHDENIIMSMATKIKVVNNPIRQLYSKLFNVTNIDIINNNNFKETTNPKARLIDMPVAFTYVGAAYRGRKIENLNHYLQNKTCSAHGFFLDSHPDSSYISNWNIYGNTNYQQQISTISKKYNTVMWCCTQTTCLSYILSIPNKFYQAMALGLPVIAYRGTYLSEIVVNYNIGYVYDDENLDEIVDGLSDHNIYNDLLNNVVSFKKELFNNGLVL